MDLRENSPLNVSDTSVDVPVQTPWYRKKITLIIVAVVATIAVVVFAAAYSDYLGAKVAPGKKFKILGPSSITAGQKATITWDTSTEGARQYPYEKIEYCFGAILKRKCILLASAAPNTGKVVVAVPVSLPVGKGFFKFTARDPKKKLFATFTANSSAITVKPAVVAKKEESVSSSGGSGGGGGSGNNSGSSGGTGGGNGDTGGGGSQPTPVLLYTPVIVTSLCVDPSPYQVDIVYYVSPEVWKKRSWGMQYREKGVVDWKNMTEYSPSLLQLGYPGPEYNPYGFMIAHVPVDKEGGVRSNATYEFRYPGDGNIFELATGPVPMVSEQSLNGCAFRKAVLPTLPNFASLPDGVTVGNFQYRQDGDFIVVTFDTNKPVFLSQLEPQIRYKTASQWLNGFGGYGPEYSDSYYRQSTTHSLRFLPSLSTLTGKHEGKAFEFRVLKKGGDQIGEIFSFVD